MNAENPITETGIQRQMGIKPAGSGRGNFLVVLGGFLIVFCGGLIVTYVSEIITGTTKHGVSSQLGLITFLAGLVFVGWKLIQGRLAERKAVKELKEEQLILTRAKAKDGSLTVSETALECRISIADTKKAFERLAITGVCRIDVTDEGELCYRFPSLRLSLKKEESYLMGMDFDPAQQFESKTFDG